MSESDLWCIFGLALISLRAPGLEVDMMKVAKEKFGDTGITALTYLMNNNHLITQAITDRKEVIRRIRVSE